MIMKKKLFLSLLAFIMSIPTFAAAGDVVINETNFPDANFRNYLLTNEDPLTPIYVDRLDENRYKNIMGINGFGADGILTQAELEQIYGITMENVEDLTGIEHFSRLCYLNCTGITTETVNLPTTLTVVKLQGSFKSVNTSEMPNLWGLKLDSPNLTSLDLPANSFIEYLHLNNTNITTIDLSPITQSYFVPALGRIIVGIYNPQKQITVIPPTNGFDLSLTIENSLNTNLDFSNFSSLRNLNLINNSSLTSLTLPSDKTLLKDLILHDNPLLTTLNVDDYTALEILSYTGNGFKSVNVNENTSLKVLECYGNELTSLDVSNNTALNFLFCQDNLLTSLDLSNNTDLRGLECYNNQLTELDLSCNTKLRTEVIDILPNNPAASTSDRIYTFAYWKVHFEMWLQHINAAAEGDDYGSVWVFTPSINLSPQSINKNYISIDGRSKLGVQCNTNDGVLANYGNCTMTTSDGNNYIVVADEANGKTDVHKPNSSINYVYTTGYTGAYDAAKTMAVNIGTSAHGMYIHPETLRGSDNFYSGTLYLEFPAKIPEGVQCYYAKGLDANEDLVGLTEVTGTIPANTAVIVKAPSEYKFFAFNESDETPAAPTNNIIEGTIEGLSVAPGTVLTLGHNVDRSTGEYDNFGFWNYRGNQISPFRAYIPKSNLTAGAKQGFSLLFPEDNTTGIARMSYSNAAEEGEWYTLGGMRLAGKPTTKGIYVNNGQKVVIK